ncbi:MAG: NYN domain-containing protein [Atopobiaceae bacterium]|nr:NYN domain-containing protein [Atopobiaceae bacterium]
MASKRGLLVVDGYNVIHKTPRYRDLVGENTRAHDMADVASLSRDPYGHDPFDRSRDLLVADVAAYAQGVYDAVIVFDAAGNINPRRDVLNQAGVRIMFSATGESADTVIEKLVTEARRNNREVLLVTSDNTIRATVGGIPITTVSSNLLAQDMERVVEDVRMAREERTHTRMTLFDHLSEEDRAKLRGLLGQ